MPHTYADGNDPTGIDFLKELVLASVNTMIFFADPKRIAVDSRTTALYL